MFPQRCQSGICFASISMLLHAYAITQSFLAHNNHACSCEHVYLWHSHLHASAKCLTVVCRRGVCATWQVLRKLLSDMKMAVLPRANAPLDTSSSSPSQAMGALHVLIKCLGLRTPDFSALADPSREASQAPLVSVDILLACTCRATTPVLVFACGWGLCAMHGVLFGLVVCCLVPHRSVEGVASPLVPARQDGATWRRKCVLSAVCPAEGHCWHCYSD